MVAAPEVRLPPDTRPAQQVVYGKQRDADNVVLLRCRTLPCFSTVEQTQVTATLRDVGVQKVVLLVQVNVVGKVSSHDPYDRREGVVEVCSPYTTDKNPVSLLLPVVPLHEV